MTRPRRTLPFGLAARALAALALAAVVLPASAQAAPPPGLGVATGVPRAIPATVSVTVSAVGLRQRLSCAGSGTVTVIVIPGLNAGRAMWSLAMPLLARTTRTCVYDRPGIGESPARLPHVIVDAGRHADELWALLVAAEVPGPYVVVGHSYGGLVARAFGARHAADVVGMVLVEGVAPYDQSSRYWHESGDPVDMLRSSRAAIGLALGSTPLVVLAAQDPNRNYWGGPSYGETAADIADWRAHQKAAASLSSNSTYVIVRHSAHVIEVDRPDAVAAAVQAVVGAARAGVPMPACGLGGYGTQPLCR